jgi:hypothetical protein
MKSKSFLCLLSGLSFCCALFFTPINNSYAIVPTVVVPNSTTNVEGNSANAYPFALALGNLRSQRYQQIYGASQFASIGAGGLITQIVFRPDSLSGGAFDQVQPDIQINLSTTNAADDALSLVFDDNVGIDDTVVIPRGPLPLSSASSGGIPKDFDIVINLTTPFFYDPSMGNLLLDVRAFSAGKSTFFDTEETSGDGVSRIFTVLSGVGSTTADLSDTEGLVTGFIFGANALELTGAASELGGFDIPLPGIECRSRSGQRERGQYSIVFTFNHNVVSTGLASTTCGASTSRTIDSNDPRRVIVELRHVVCNQSDITVSLTDINDDQGNNLATASTVMTLLLGDVTGDGVVDNRDANQVKQRKGQVTTDANLRADVNADGFISGDDLSLVRSQIGTQP